MTDEFDAKTMAEVARSAWMSAGNLDDHWAITADAVIEECIATLDGAIKSCTLGFDLVGKISEADACKLLNAQRLVDIAALRSLKSPSGRVVDGKTDA